MKPATNGPVRGLAGRWLMRVQAVQGILQLFGIAVTAASTLTTALVSVGRGGLALPLLAVGLAGSPLFAWAYVELGLFNRKNRENVDRGSNFATPRDKIDDTLIAVGVFAAVHGRPPDNDELETIKGAIDGPWRDFRDGVEL
jgi:hypothetical protein